MKEVSGPPGQGDPPGLGRGEQGFRAPPRQRMGAVTSCGVGHDGIVGPDGIVGTRSDRPGVLGAMKLPVAIASLVVLATSCPSEEVVRDPTPPFASVPASAASAPVTDCASLTQALDAAGLDVVEREPEERLIASEFREASWHQLDIGGDKHPRAHGASVSVFEFPTERALDKARSLVGDDGSYIGDTEIFWDAPRFYAAGRLLVLYFGDAQQTLDVLADLLGPPFVG